MQPKDPPAGTYTPLPQTESNSPRMLIVAMTVVLIVLCGIAAYLYIYNRGLMPQTAQSGTAQNSVATAISPTVAASTPDAVLRDINAIDVGSPESALSPVVKDVQGL